MDVHISWLKLFAKAKAKRSSTGKLVGLRKVAPDFRTQSHVLPELRQMWRGKASLALAVQVLARQKAVVSHMAVRWVPEKASSKVLGLDGSGAQTGSAKVLSRYKSFCGGATWTRKPNNQSGVSLQFYM